MSTDFHELLTGLREIYQLANFDPDNDGGMDLGQNLCNIESIAADLLQKAGWALPEPEDPIDPDYIKNVVITHDRNFQE